MSMSRVVVEEVENGSNTRDKEDNLDDCERDELPSSLPRESDEGMDDKDTGKKPANNRLVVVALLPRIVMTVNQRERDTDRRNKRGQIRYPQPSRKLALASLEADVGKGGAKNAGK